MTRIILLILTIVLAACGSAMAQAESNVSVAFGQDDHSCSGARPPLNRAWCLCLHHVDGRGGFEHDWRDCKTIRKKINEEITRMEEQNEAARRAEESEEKRLVTAIAQGRIK